MIHSRTSNNITVMSFITKISLP